MKMARPSSSIIDHLKIAVPLVCVAGAIVYWATRPDEYRTLPICEREHHWDYNVKTFTWVRRKEPQRFETVCGVAGSGRDWAIGGPGPSFENGQLISKDTPLPGRNLEVPCRKRPGRDAIRYAWAKTSDGMFCHVPTP